MRSILVKTVMSMRLARASLRAIAGVVCAFSAVQAADGQVTVREIVPPPGMVLCTPRAIAEIGDVLLRCFRADNSSVSYLYSPQSESFTLIEPPAETGFYETPAMNSTGTVVGLRRNLDFTERTLFVWTRAGGAQPLSWPAGCLCAPTAINDLGEILYVAPDGFWLRRTDGTAVRVALPSGWTVVDAGPWHLNNLSQVAVSSPNEKLLGLWSPTEGLVPLPPLTVSVPPVDGLDTAVIWGINDAGLITGITNRQALVYSPATGYVVLTPGTYYANVVRHVNALGHLAGYVMATSAARQAPTLWKTLTAPIALPVLDQAHTWAIASNSSGLVVGAAGTKAVLWSLAAPPPTPQQQVAAISATITSFASSSLINENDAKGLASKIDAINVTLGKGDTPSTKNVLQALSNQVSALEKSGRVSATTAASLRDLINAAAASL